MLSDVLCFLRNNFSKVPLKQLKCVIVDFYTAVDLSEAKVRLLSDIEALKSSVKFPHVPQRRDGEARLAHEADDLISLFNCLDEHKLLDRLPRYVSGDPDRMPSTRGVVTALKPVQAEQVRRPEPPVALGVRGYYLLPGKFKKKV